MRRKRRDNFYSGAVDHLNYANRGTVEEAYVSEQKGANRQVRRNFAKLMRKDNRNRGTVANYLPTSENEPYRDTNN